MVELLGCTATAQSGCCRLPGIASCEQGFAPRGNTLQACEGHSRFIHGACQLVRYLNIPTALCMPVWITCADAFGPCKSNSL